MRSEYQWHFKANKTGAYLKTKYTERTKKRAGAHTHAQNQSGVPHKQTQKKIKKITNKSSAGVETRVSHGVCHLVRLAQ